MKRSTFRDYATVSEFRETLFMLAEEGTLPIEDIAIMMQKRAEGTDQELVLKYQEAMQAQIEATGDHKFPAIDICVVETDGNQTPHLTDGYHRYFAARNLGLTDIRVRIAMNCHFLDAEFYAQSSNMDHGKLTSSQTVAELLVTLLSSTRLSDEECEANYERWIDAAKATTKKKDLASYCGCSVDSIKKLEAIQEYDYQLKKARDLKIKLATDAGKNLQETAAASGASLGTVHKTVKDFQKREVPLSENPKQTPTSLFEDSDATATSEGSDVETTSSINLDMPWGDDDEFAESLASGADLEAKLKAVDQANARGLNVLAKQLGEKSKHSGLTPAEKALNTVRAAHCSLAAFTDKHDLSDLAKCLADDGDMKKHAVDLHELLSLLIK